MSADIHGLSGAYAVDAIDSDERAAFEEHLAQCPECQAEVASLREAATQLATTTETQPPASLRSAVLAGITTIRPLPPLDPPVAANPAPDAMTAAVEPADTDASVVVPLRRRRRVPWLLAAAAAVLVGIGGLAWSPWSHTAGSQLTATEQVLRADDAQRLQKTIGGAHATIVRSASLGQAVLIADKMPDAPTGKDYQLWLDIPGQGMVSAGLMPRDAKQPVTVLLKGDARKAIGAGITVEPAGGSPKPTTQPIALFMFT
ncbi:anti-sigma factor [Pedococcus sp.]|jgi:anti-sigma-K factor RskA|uniref:anti-sigma factor n=1 Tax=Pedococcus sp. TaxID=2860345 RepID=UPI002E0E51B7|nr:anti-sigma factor [Pedococcus sp.]